jgi:hypothetical protein
MIRINAMIPTSMTINNNVFAESRFWQCLSGENRVRRTHERLPSNGFIERDACH